MLVLDVTCNTLLFRRVVTWESWFYRPFAGSVSIKHDYYSNFINTAANKGTLRLVGIFDIEISQFGFYTNLHIRTIFPNYSLNCQSQEDANAEFSVPIKVVFDI